MIKTALDRNHARVAKEISSFVQQAHKDDPWVSEIQVAYSVLLSRLPSNRRRIAQQFPTKEIRAIARAARQDTGVRDIKIVTKRGEKRSGHIMVVAMMK